tara:strand:- start:111 stop:344 length:234 start_codon:yes stop_codon:yes gene_type:complete
MVRQREAGIKEDLTEEIMLVESALSSYVEESFSSEALQGDEGVWATMDDAVTATNNVKELEKAWDRIKRSVENEPTV